MNVGRIIQDLLQGARRRFLQLRHVLSIFSRLNQAEVSVEKYAVAARVIWLYLSAFRDDTLPADESIAQCARRAARTIGELEARIEDLERDWVNAAVLKQTLRAIYVACIDARLVAADDEPFHPVITVEIPALVQHAFPESEEEMRRALYDPMLPPLPIGPYADDDIPF